MKKSSIFKLSLAILLCFSLILTGCGNKGGKTEDSVNLENGIEDKGVEVAEDKGSNQVEETEADEEIEEEQDEEVLVEGPDDGEKNIGEKKDQSKKEKDNKAKNRVENKEPESSEDEPAKDAKNILKIEGSVGQKLAFSLDQLKSKNNLIFKGNFFSINNFGTKSYTEFKGVNLWKLLEEAQISSKAKTVEIIAVDGYKMEFTLDQVKRQDYIDETNPDAKFPMIIAWEEEGQEYDPEEGPPFKLIIGQKEPGDVNKPQWVSKIDKILVK